MNQSMTNFATKSDLREVELRLDARIDSVKDDVAKLHRAMYVVNLVQFSAIIGSLLAIVNFMNN
jgi:hypothetical protein